MKILDIQVDPAGSGGRTQPVLSFTAITRTVGGQEIEARVVISSDEVHRMMVKATKNKVKRSHDGPVTVKVMRHTVPATD